MDRVEPTTSKKDWSNHFLTLSCVGKEEAVSGRSVGCGLAAINDYYMRLT